MKPVLKSSYTVLLALLVLSAMVLPAIAGQPLFPGSPTQVNVMVQGPWLTTYLDVYFDNVPAGYVLTDGGPYYGWCADLDHRISTGHWYIATLDEPTASPWPEIAWVINNWGVGHDKYFVQAVIWRLKLFSWAQITPWLPFPVDQTYRNAVDAYVATAQGHSGFTPGPGQYHAVRINIVTQNCEPVQLIFFELLQPRNGVPEFSESVPMVASAVGALLLLTKVRVPKRRN